MRDEDKRRRGDESEGGVGSAAPQGQALLPVTYIQAQIALVESRVTWPMQGSLVTSTAIALGLETCITVKRTLLATLPLTIVALLGVAQGACSNGANGSAQSGSRQSATAVLQSKGLGLGKNSAALSLRPLGGGTPGSIPLTLVNVTGEADSLLILHNGTDSCGFEAWAARSQPGPVAVTRFQAMAKR